MEGIVYRHLTHKKKKNGEVSWILAKMNLYDYIGNLKRNFFDYDIQRRIVPNLYLDKIWETVLRDDFIPSITLTTTDKAIETDFSKDENLINLSQQLYLQLIIPQYFISNKSGIWSLSLIVHSKG